MILRIPSELNTAPLPSEFVLVTLEERTSNHDYLVTLLGSVGVLDGNVSIPVANEEAVGDDGWRKRSCMMSKFDKRASDREGHLFEGE